MLGIAGLLAAWALILAFVGGVTLGSSPKGRGIFLLLGAGMMALTSLSAWLGVINREQRRRVGLRIVQVAAATISFGTVAWAIVHPEPQKLPRVVAVVAGGFFVAWLAGRCQRRMVYFQRRTRTSIL